MALSETILGRRFNRNAFREGVPFAVYALRMRYDLLIYSDPVQTPRRTACAQYVVRVTPKRMLYTGKLINHMIQSRARHDSRGVK